jgi:6-pyruvoyltetrahydropterin/6-carboxytetrahydropterin synthase
MAAMQKDHPGWMHAMVEVGRTVRFFLNAAQARSPAPQRHNGFSAWPPPRGLAGFYQLHVVCRGRVDPITGYFLNISQIDEAVRRHVIPFMEQAAAAAVAGGVPMGALLRQTADRLREPLAGSVATLRLDLSPFHSLEIGAGNMNKLIIRQQFEFAAAHRLHVDTLSEQENRRIFGKCNHAAGHGHNYHLVVSVTAPVDAQGHVLAVEELDAVVDRTVIEKFDHKNLNLDVPQFRQLNPSVENIARVVFDELCEPVKGLGVQLEEVSVWETQKTVCTYRGEG